MTTHIYIDVYKTNATFCTSKNNGDNNQCGLLLTAKDVSFFNKYKDDPTIKWCKKCIKKLKYK